MKKILVVTLMMGLSLTSCKKEAAMNDEEMSVDSTSVETPVDMHNAMSSLDYQGTYVGSLPCADCEAIETKIILTDDSFIKEMVYKGKSKEVYKESGSIEWNKEGNTITLVGASPSNLYFVGENVLFHLDSNGKRIEGSLAPYYELKKELKSDRKEETNSVTENKIKGTKSELKNSKWKLVKLNGKTIENSSKEEVKGITFTSDGRMSAYAGCNRMGGEYKLDEKSLKIKFSNVFSTKMACENMETEDELSKVLSITDNYYFDGNLLKFNKGKMATLAEFVIIK